ncbi:MAG: peptidoglycan-binding protein LysM [Burkholderiaceae bacterium]|jgi:nucleoid-associated protein YgaU|nr:peptidoglycan-binding protein LysM [Burkholderiaceae bacterium]MCU0928470.1 peptidoglycan-binding protein LysM [Burkholderiaceae bacterium]
MGLISFIKEAGEKLFGKGEAKAAQEAAAKAPSPEAVAKANRAAADAIVAYIGTMGLKVDGLAVDFDGASRTVTVSGQVADQPTKEKVVLCCGNVEGVAAVNDMLVVVTPQPEAKIYVVVKGDTLSKISKEFYGTPNKYMQIFEANKPMLTHPDKIYPGQALRIPPDA